MQKPGQGQNATKSEKNFLIAVGGPSLFKTGIWGIIVGIRALYATLLSGKIYPLFSYFLPVCLTPNQGGDATPPVRGRQEVFCSLKVEFCDLAAQNFKIFRACGAYRHHRASIPIIIVHFQQKFHKFREKRANFRARLRRAVILFS